MQTHKNYSQTSSIHRLRKWIRLVMALTVGFIGVTNLMITIVPRLNWDILLGVWSGDIHHGLPKLMVVVGFFLLMLSYGLARGKYEAWCASMILLLLSACLHSVGGQTVVTVMTGVLIILLVLFARFFRAKSDPPSVWRGYIALLSGLGIVTLYTIGGLVVLYDQFEPLIDRFGTEEVVLRLLTNAHLHLPYGTQALIFGRALPVLCLSAVLYGIAMLLRPVAVALFPGAHERQTASALIQHYGTSSISYFALDADKSYFFSASGKSVISYALRGNVAVVAGDPIGPEEEALPAVAQFMDFCQEQDWRVVFWQTRDTLSDVYRKAGLHLLKIGEDAIIKTDTFTLAGKAMANVRSMVKRAEKQGIHVIFSHGPIENVQLLTQMEHISRTWLANKGSTEMGFSMGQFDIHGNREQVYALAVDCSNIVHAFVTFVPIYGRAGWALDLMRRGEQAAPGTMELLLARSIEHLKSRGANIVSLGLAPLGNVLDSQESFLGTSIDFLSQRFGHPDGNHSLFAFKKKFQPSWESRYLVYSSTLTLPKVGWALYHVHQRDVSLLTACSRFFKQCQCQHRSIVTRVPDHSTSGGLSL